MNEKRNGTLTIEFEGGTKIVLDREAANALMPRLDMLISNHEMRVLQQAMNLPDDQKHTATADVATKLPHPVKIVYTQE